jgi:glucose/arabinose dehydrogenase
MNIQLRYQFPGNNQWPFLLLAVILVFFFSSFAKGQTFPTDFGQTQVVNGLSGPTALVFAPASDGRIFVTEQGGKLRVIKNGILLSTEAISLTVDSDGERGLIGVTLDPDFLTNHYIYLYHTIPGSPAHNRISRYTLDGDVVLSGSESIVLDLDDLSSATNHNGGSMAFGPDGKLYVGVGENAHGANAQDLDVYLGKLLRINADGSVPAGNPFTGGSARSRIWAYGLRNPYTFDFQPGTGVLFVNDVGESTWEEINDATDGGLNFGWSNAEGNSTNPAYTNPVYEYGHGSGDGLGCAITGGTFFNPSSSNYPGEYTGKYFFMDLCEKWINYIDPTEGSPTRHSFATGLPGSSLAITTGPDGNLYYLSRDAGALYKISYNGVTAVQTSQSVGSPVVYPLPASETLYVSMIPALDNYTINFTDSKGNIQAASYSAEGSVLKINISSLPSGVYAMKIGNASRTVIQQVSILR